MERIDPNLIAAALLDAPGWARAGLAAETEQLRRQSARELALAIVEEIDGPLPSLDPAQMALAL